MITPRTATEQLFFVTAHLQCQKPGNGWSGTGFFVRVPITHGDDQVLLITNRHVLSDPDLGTAETVHIITPAANPANPSNPLFGHPAILIAKEPVFQSHSKPDIDVAVMGINDLPIVHPNNPFIKTLPADMLTNDEALAQLDAIELVTFIGYPNALYDTVNMTPIARRGWTATPISLDHNGKPMFLIDASVFPGSSGSPVFVVNPGSYTDRQGNLIFGGGPRIVLLGIVAAVYLHATTGELVPALNLPKVAVKQVMNLGIVYKMRTIVEAIDQFLACKGLARAQQSGVTPTVAPADPPAPVLPA